jgi:hypothetical protein
MEMLWLAEHHFDGICAYVDPVTFAAALAAVPSAPGGDQRPGLGGYVAGPGPRDAAIAPGGC